MTQRSSSPSIKRVPPPPPPGFGDEDYYRLYGRPEEYLQKRLKYERTSDSRPRSASGHSLNEDHEEFYYYRRSRKSVQEEEYDYYRHSSKSKRPVHERLSKKRSYYDEVHRGRGRQRPPPPPPSPPPDSYENFKVTIANESDDGTPSLSGVDTDSIDSSQVERSEGSASSYDSEPEQRHSKGQSRRRHRSPVAADSGPGTSRHRPGNDRTRGGTGSRGGKRQGKSPQKFNSYRNRAERENEMMQKRLEKRVKKPRSEFDKNKALAKLAGIDVIQKPSKSTKRLKVGGMESTSRGGKRGRILMSRSRSRSPKKSKGTLESIILIYSIFTKHQGTKFIWSFHI